MTVILNTFEFINLVENNAIYPFKGATLQFIENYRIDIIRIFVFIQKCSCFAFLKEVKGGIFKQVATFSFSNTYTTKSIPRLNRKRFAVTFQ